jgi:hypothetical protein
MLLAIANHLRCADGHEPTWLVARADRVEGRRMVEGVLGCPLCGVERAVRSGVVWWTGGGSAAPPAGEPDPDEGAVTRAGALLGYGESTAPFVLCGAAGAFAIGLAGLADAPLVLLDPPDDRSAALATVIRGARAVPLRAGAARGICVDERFSDAEFLQSCIAALAQGGRLAAPAAVQLPTGIQELARDDANWVGVRVPDVVPLGRRPINAS